jgi:peptidyl-prolyl cis-trans isomerase C
MRRTAALGFAALMVLGCNKGHDSSDTHKSGAVLAKGAGFEITAGEFKARVDAQPPFQRAKYAVPGKRKEFLDQMIQDEVLYRQAEKEGLKDDPQFQQFVRTYLGMRLQQKHAHQTDPATVPAAEVQKYFDEHSADYQKRVSVSIVSFLAAPSAPERAKKLADAKKALQNLRAAEKDQKLQASVPALFQKLVAEASEDDMDTKRRDPMLRTQDELAKARPELAAAIAGMKQNEISEPISTDKGVYLVRVNAVREAIGLDQVRPSIQLRLARLRDEKDRSEFVQKLRDEAKVTVDEKELEAVAVAPVQPASMAPPPGHAPPPSTQPSPEAPAIKVEPATSKPAGK